MPRQRQVDEALQRAFDGRKPSGKVRCSIEDEGRTLLLHHYEHLLLRYNLQLGEPLFQWHKKPTDKRILNAALEALAADGQRMQQQAQQGGGASAAGAGEGQGEGSAADVAAEEQVQTRFGSMTVARGHSVEEKGSVFLALAAFPAATRAAADAAVTLLQRRPELGGADHRIACYRASDGAEFMDDDGEDRAGSSLRAALRKQKALGCAVVVGRWYGGVNIGKARFRHIQDRAVTLLRALGHTPGGGALSSTERVWAKAGAGHSLGGAAAQALPSGGAAPAAAEAAGTGGGRDLSAASEAELRRARMAAAAEARFGGGAAQGGAADLPAEPATEATERVAAQPAARREASPQPRSRVGGEEEAADGRKRQRTSPTARRDLPHWACAVCTLLNVATAERCAACDGERPVRVPPSGANTGEVVDLVDD